MARKRTVPLLVVVVVLICVACASMLLRTPPIANTQSWKREYCTRCGSYSSVQESSYNGWGWRERTLTPTPLSDWHATNFGGDCDHEWMRNHGDTSHGLWVFGVEVRSGSREAGSGHRPALLKLRPQDRARLDDLLSQSPEICQDHITRRLTGRWQTQAWAHTPKVKAALAAHPEYAKLSVVCVPVMADGTRVTAIYIGGEVRSAEEDTRLRAIVAATEPPVYIDDEITVEPPTDGPTE